jgi:hypothetical protein
MLRPVVEPIRYGFTRLADQWRAIERELPENWGDARLKLTVTDPGQARAAAARLAPLQPGVRARELRFYVARRGSGPAPDRVRRALERLDRERIRGTLELVGSEEPAVVPPTTRPTLAASWDAALAALPNDWSDAYCELELRSTDDLDRAALKLSPLNPARFGGRPAFRFRAARRFGYGASAGMVRTCLERLDEASIRGEVRILRALSDTRPVATQGPVWYVEGRAI